MINKECLTGKRDDNPGGAGLLKREQIKIGGMMCSYCADTIKKALSRTPGVSDVKVNLAHEEALVVFDPEQVDSQKLRDVLKKLRYVVKDPKKMLHFEEEEQLLKLERRRLIFGLVYSGFTTGIMALNWMNISLPYQKYLLAILASAALFGAGRHILAMSFTALRLSIFNQHVLLTFGALGAYGAGALSFFIAIPDFFGAATYLTTFHLLSGYLSALVRTKSSKAVHKLLSLQPTVARVIRNGKEIGVPIEEVRKGDIVAVRPGERIPVDGKVVEGVSSVDQALVTGEAIPVDKSPGDSVIGGSINISGALMAEVTQVGEETFLSRIASYVEEARALKPGIIILADRILAVFVPAVLIIAGASFIGWYFGSWALWGKPALLTAVYTALSVLIIGYPCALGMATPLALIRGSAVGAERGVLMRSGEAFQALKDVKKIILDKTGTITQGRPEVSRVVPADGTSEKELMAIASAAEKYSEHPIGKAIVEYAGKLGIERSASGFRSFPGYGVRAVSEGDTVSVGNPRFIKDMGIDISAAKRSIEELEAKGVTAVLVAKNDKVAGLIGISDKIKGDAAKAIGGLKKLGLSPLMITGDNRRAAESVASMIGIDEVMAEVLPHDKSERVKEIQKVGHRVVMVGDGINDAPALMQADIGIALGAGTDIAIESSDVILIRGDLTGVIDAIELSVKTYSKIKQNLIWAFLFNGLGIPIATTGVLHPLLAMSAMVASTTAIILNSFAVKLIRRPIEPKPILQLQLEVPTIHCSGCISTIRGELKGLGVRRVRGDLSSKMVLLTIQSGEGELAEKVLEKLKSLGHEIKEHSINVID